ncbi:MAG: FHA domain-containing protein, partial [Minisyncoccota bacterium]
VVVARALPDVATGVTPAAEVHRVAHLIIRDSPDSARKGTLVPVGDAALLVGRGTDCNLSISDEGLSRRHAEVFRQGSDVVVRDVGSSNGTYVNSVRVSTEQALRHGDVVVMGLTTIAFEDPEAIARIDTVDTSRVRTPSSAPPPPLPLPPLSVATPAPPVPPPPPAPALPRNGVTAKVSPAPACWRSRKTVAF